jgi:2-oxoglutarate ferredoxin oxidoreductase subunit alpha
MSQTDPTVVVRVGGEGGEGTITLGDIFTRVAARVGLEVYSFRTYPAEIKGGQVMYQARLGVQRVMTEGDEADVLVAMNRAAWEESHDDLCPHPVLIYEASLDLPRRDDTRYPVPAEQIAQDLDWPRGKNFVLLGALIHFFKFPLDAAEAIVRRRMQRHPESLGKNLAAMRQGYDYVRVHYPEAFPYTLPLPEEVEERLILSGADAMALGALAAGCKFYAGYPITPATPVMEAMAKYLPPFGGTLIQAEDEIAAINMAIGGAYAGKRAMTATSGPGLSLMIETLGLASMAEIPLVIINVQRAGPSTGLPTKTSQGDLFLALYGGHGDAPRFVLAPDSVKDGYFQMIYAFSLAERFQMPVVVLCDQAMAARMETTPLPGEPWNGPLTRRLPTEAQRADDYRRYRDTETGISPMAIPGMAGGMYLAESLEHNAYGYPDQTPENHEHMMRKRAKKVETAREMLVDWKMTARRWGDAGAPFGIIGWGSTRGAVREAMAALRTQGIRIEAIYPHTLLPMPDRAICDFLSTKRALLIPELNFSGQFGRMIEHRYYREMDERNIHVHPLTKEQGVPFKVRDIQTAVIEMLMAERKLWMERQGELVDIYAAAERLAQQEEVQDDAA